MNYGAQKTSINRSVSGIQERALSEPTGGKKYKISAQNRGEYCLVQVNQKFEFGIELQIFQQKRLLLIFIKRNNTQ